MSSAEVRASLAWRWLASGESAVTRNVHRAFFATVARLPRPAARWVQARIFNGLFRSGTPWPYSESTFESVKRGHLMSAVPTGARQIVEIGCADGHNLEALAEQFTNGQIMGVDISDRSCVLARQRVSGRENVDVVRGDSAALLSSRPDLVGAIDAVVLSEVLYYFGTGQAFVDQVAPLRCLLAPWGVVIAVHTCADASTLHERLAQAMDVSLVSEGHFTVDGKAFAIAVLAPSA